jgi:hypothetical protein
MAKQPQKPDQPSDQDVIDEVAELYSEQADARALLDRIGYPRTQVGEFGSPARFWQNIARQLRGGILEDVDDLRPLIERAAETYPGNRVFRAWLGPTPAPAAAAAAVDIGATILLSTRADVFELIDLARHLAQERGLTAPVRLLWASGDNVALYLQGADTEEALRFSNALHEALDGRLMRRPTVAADPVPDYLIHRLFVEGPDSARFEFNGVPGSTPVRDLARGLMSHYNEKMWPRDERGQARPTVVNHVQPDGASHRLNPDRTLNQEGIGEDATLRVAPAGTAGAGVNPLVREEALARARAQVLDYARSHPGFEVMANAHHAPTEYVFRFRAAGWAPPTAAEESPAPIDWHEIYLLLSPDFPLKAPIAFWQTDVFHPNIDPQTGKVCLGVLEDRYRPGLDFGELCQVLVDIARYENYEVREGYNPKAQEWAISPEGQMLIESRGGQSVSRMLLRTMIQDVQDPLPLRIKRIRAGAEAVSRETSDSLSPQDPGAAPDTSTPDHP